MKQYFNAHNHGIGSLLDGMSKVDEYAQRCIDLGQPAFTFTDHGNLMYLMEAYKKSQELGLPFLPGMEAYAARKSRFDKDGEEMSGPATDEWAQRGPYHQTILAYNNAGYQNLLKLSSRAYREGYLGGKARIDKELLSEHSEGIILLSSCLSGAVQQALLVGDYKKALNEAYEYQQIVGKDNYFIEIMDHGIPEEIATHEGLIRISKTIGAPIVASNDSHYTFKDDYGPHSHMLCISTGARISDPKRFQFSGPEFHLKSYEEMALLFPEEYLDNSLLIVDKFDIKLDLTQSHYPEFKVPDQENITVPDYFIKQISIGAKERFGPTWQKDRRDVADRINTEIQVIRDMGYDSYFLIVQDIIQWCHENGILIGYGRGSAAASMVSYCLGITHVDPIEYGLLFERFLTAGRVPDIDVDIDDRHRDSAIEYIRNKYGEDYTAHIGTMAQMKAKSVVNDVCRVSDKPFDYAQGITALMPPAEFGKPKTLQECLATAGFKERYDTDPEAKEIIDICLRLEDSWRQSGIHAGGIIISDEPLTNFCPVMQKGEGTPIVLQWDMRTAEDIGLLKLDLLGLRNLGIIDDTIQRVRKDKNPELAHPYELIKNPDPAVFEFLSEGNTALVFQMASDGLTDMVRKMGIHSISDIAAALALYRPGPMDSGVHHKYARRKKGLEPSTPLHPLVEDILADTYNLLLYQEQIMVIGQRIAGFDEVASNKFLKSIGKKDREVMAATKGKFIQGCVNTSGITEEEAASLYAAIEPHADYSFGKAHAVSYAFISYITAFLKYYYPVEYAAANLTAVMLKDEKTFRPVLNDVRDKMGVRVDLPSINTSSFDFVNYGDKVLFSISGLKGIGEKKSKPFVEHRDEKQVKYNSIAHMFRTTNLDVFNKTLMEAFIDSGALDELVDPEMVAHYSYDVKTAMDCAIAEMKVLGLSLTENLYALYKETLQEEVKSFTVSKCMNLDGKSRDFHGVIKSAEFKTSKRGAEYGRLEIEDDKGFWDVIVFSKSIGNIKAKVGDDFHPFLSTGNFIDFKARVRKEEIDGEDEQENVTLFLTDLNFYHTPESIDEMLNSVTIRLDIFNKRYTASDIAKSYPGNNKVYLECKHPDAHLYLRELLPDRCSDQGIQKIKELK
jgi:DNA polymerase-3 subunit alpha